MQKSIFFLLLITTCSLFLTPLSLAQSPTPSPSISTSQKNESLVQQINELKDKIASRVAQLKLVEKRGVVGVVTEVSDTRISLTTQNGDIQLIDVDEITKFSSPDKSEFGISDVTKGSTVSVIGLYNKESKHILARYVSTFTLPLYLQGTVEDTNADDFTITVSGMDNKNTIVDIEKTTKINSYANGSDIVRSGFSKLVKGDKVNIVGYAGKTDKTRVSASNVLQLNDLSSGASSPSPTK
jgi:hypothetical protein